MKKTLVSLAIALTVMTGLQMIAPSTASAQTAANSAACGKSGFMGFPTWYKYLNPRVADPDGDGPRAVECSIDFEFPASIGPVLLAVFEILLRVAGIVAVAFIIVGGFQYILSQGEPDRTAGAKSTILNALIGLALAISATAIVNLISNSIT